MLTEPLPKTLDARKAAARGVTVKGTLDLSELDRFGASLAHRDGQVEATLVFVRDEEHRHIIQASVEAEVEVICQRCLEPMPIVVTGKNQLAVVWSDDQAGHLPKHLEPVIVSEERTDLWSIVEDELILALPFISYHDPDQCRQSYSGNSEVPEAAVAEQPATKSPNPFEVLAQLKPDKK